MPLQSAKALKILHGLDQVLRLEKMIYLFEIGGKLILIIWRQILLILILVLAVD